MSALRINEKDSINEYTGETSTESTVIPGLEQYGPSACLWTQGILR